MYKNIIYAWLSVFLLNSPSLANSEIEFENWDASVLYPFPNKETLNSLISTTTHQELLPFDLFKKTNFLINRPDSVTYSMMKVIALRIDPCFSEGPPPFVCEKQIRFIWQPMAEVGNDVFDIDASVHVFFRLSDPQFLGLIRDIDLLKKKFDLDPGPFKNQPLNVHPYLQHYGLGSDFTLKFNAIFSKWASLGVLNRMTFMKLKGSGDIWIFGGFLVGTDSTQEIEIPLINDTSQDFINTLAIRPRPRGFLGGVFPEPAEIESHIGLIVKDSENINLQSETELIESIRAIAKFENPSLHNPGTLDCVSCHLTTTVRSWAIDNFPTVNLESIYEAERYKNANEPLQNITPNPGQTNRLRLFGYFESKPAIGQRTINETAEVVKAIRTLQ